MPGYLLSVLLREISQASFFTESLKVVESFSISGLVLHFRRTRPCQCEDVHQSAPLLLSGALGVYADSEMSKLTVVIARNHENLAGEKIELP